MRNLIALLAIVLSFLSRGTDGTVGFGSSFVSLGSDHTCLLLSGEQYCFGYDRFGQAGMGWSRNFTDPNQPYSTHGIKVTQAEPMWHYPNGTFDLKVAAITAGFQQTCVLYSDHQTVHCCGLHGNRHGGDGSATSPLLTNFTCLNRLDEYTMARAPILAPPIVTQYPIIQLDVGRFAACELRSNGGVRCWGSGAFGIVGFSLPVAPKFCIDSDCPTLVPFQVPGGGDIGDSPTGLFVIDEVSAVQQLVFDPSLTVTQISVSDYHACALLSSGMVRCWGQNQYSGGIKFNSLYAETSIVGQLPITTFPPELVEHSLVYIATQMSPTFAPILQVSTGTYHTCFLFLFGGATTKIACVGLNTYGQLGSGSVGGKCVSTFGTVTCEVYINPPAMNAWAMVVAGAEHTCALATAGYATGAVYCWGRNNYGQLGLGDTTNRGAYSSFVSFQATAGHVAAVFTGGYHNCAVFGLIGDAPRRLRCWGNGQSFRLGTPTASNVGTIPAHMPALGPVPLPPGRLDPWDMFPRIGYPTGGILVKLRGPQMLIGGVASVRLTSGIGPFTVTVPATVTYGMLTFAVPNWTSVVPAGSATIDDAKVEVITAVTSIAEDIMIKFRFYGKPNHPVHLRPKGSALEGNTSIALGLPDAGVYAGLTEAKCTYTTPTQTYSVLANVHPTNETVTCTPNRAEPAAGTATFTVTLGEGFPPSGPYTLSIYNVILTGISTSVGQVTGGYPLNIYGTGIPNTGDTVECVFYVNILSDNYEKRLPINLCPDLTCVEYPDMIDFTKFDELQPYLSYLWTLLPAKFLLFVSFNGQTQTNPVVHWIFDTPKINAVSPSATHWSETVSLVVRGDNLYNVYENSAPGNVAMMSDFNKFGFVPKSNAVRPRLRFKNAATPALVVNSFCTWISTGVMHCPAPKLTDRADAGKWLIDFSFNGIVHSQTVYTYSYFTVMSVSPQAGPNTGGTSVTLRGIGFVAEASLRCRTTAAGKTTNVLFLSSTEVVCPSSDLGNSTVLASAAQFQLTMDGVNWSDAVADNTLFVVYQEPTVTAMTPLFGPTYRAVTLSLFAPSFFDIAAILPTIRPYEARCRIDGVVGNATIVSSSQVTCVTPLIDKAAVAIDVFLALNGFDFFRLPIAYHCFSLVSSDPIIGPASGGTRLLLSGSGYSATQMTGAILCRVGTSEFPAFFEDGSLVCNLGPNSVGAHLLSVMVDPLSGWTTDLVTFTHYPTPLVTALSPTSGPPGTVVSVYGDNFGTFPGSSVSLQLLSSIPAPIITNAFPSYVTFAAPSGVSPGPLDVSITLNDGADYSNRAVAEHVAFNLFVVNGLTPVAGPMAGGSLVLVSGNGFYATVPASDSVCRFGTTVVPAEPFIKGTLTSCLSPAAAVAGPVPFAFSMNGGVTWSTETLTFEFYPSPSVSSLAPTGGPAVGGILVTVTGSGFVNTGFGQIRCRFGAYMVPASSTTLVSSTEVRCIAPSNLAGGSLEVQISLNDGYDWTTDSAKFGFLVIASLAPTFGPTVGGGTVVVSGSGFAAGSTSVPTCDFGSAKTTGLITNFQIVNCPVPAAAGPGPINLDFSLDGVIYTGAPLPYSYYTAPVVTAILPIAGPGPGAAVEVTLFGSNFDISPLAASVVCRFDVKAAEPVRYLLIANYVVCRTPVDSSGTDTVELSFNGGFDYTDSKLVYTYYSVNTLEPAQAPVGGGTNIVVSGSGFLSGVPIVCVFGLIPVDAVYLSPAQVTCAAPKWTGPAKITVEIIVASSRPTTNAVPFVYYLAPSVTFLSPTAGPSLGGIPVTVSGVNFLDLVGACRFGQVSAKGTFVRNAATGSFDLVCPSAVGSGVVFLDISLNAGFDFTNSRREYRYFFIFSISPTLGPTFTPSVPLTSVTVTGGGFVAEVFPADAGPVCLFGTREAPLTVVDSVRITCTAPNATVASLVDFQLFVPAHARNGTLVSAVVSGSFGIPYRYYTQPVVTALVPDSGPAQGGVSVTIYGANFIEGQVIFGLATLTPVLVSPSVLTFVTAKTSATSAFVDVALSFNRQQEVAAGRYFPFFLTSVSPPLGPDDGGTVVQVLGTGFRATNAFLSCRFGLVVVPGTYVNPNLYTCVSPPRADALSGKSSAPVNSTSSVPSPATATNGTTANGTSAASPTAPTPASTPTPTSTPAPSPAVPAGNGTANGTTNGTSPSPPPLLQRRLAGLASAPIVVPFFASTSGADYLSVAGVDFLYYAAPVIESVDPTEGNAAGNSTVGVIGSGFSVGARALPTCHFAALDDPERVPVPALAYSDSRVECVTPAHTATTVPVLIALNAQQFHASASATFTYKDCLPGFFAPTHRDPCLPCLPGSAIPIRGAQKCLVCDTTFYAPEPAMVECERCPLNSMILSAERISVDQCECFPDFYSPTLKMGTACEPCPEGGVCLGGTNAPRPKTGYWLSREEAGSGSSAAPSSAAGTGGSSSLQGGDQQQFIFLLCDLEKACPGGEIDLSDASSGCAQGYTGRLCAVCEKGYFKRRGECLPCPPAAILTLVAAGVAVVLFCVLMKKLVGPEVSAYGGTVNITVYFLQVVGILSKLDLKWPVSLERTMTYANIVNIDIDLLGPECSSPTVSFQQKWLVKMVFPILFLVISITIFGMSYLASKLRKDTGLKHDKSVAKVKLLGDVLVNMYLLILSLNYLFLVTTTFQLFDCTMRADGLFTLDAQPNLLCYDKWWYRLLPIGLAGVVIYAITIPVVFFVLVKRNQKRLDEPRVIGRIGSTFIDYRPERPYWEAAAMLEKVGIACTLTFFTTFVDVQIIAFLLVTVMGLASHIIANPFFISRYNRLQTLLRWCSCLMIMAGMIFRAGNFPSAFVQIVVTGGVFVIIGMSVILVTGIIVYDVLMIKRALGASFDKETSDFIVTITTPQGKTEIMEWLGSGVDEKLMANFSRVIKSIGRYYKRTIDDPDCPVPEPEGGVEEEEEAQEREAKMEKAAKRADAKALQSKGKDQASAMGSGGPLAGLGEAEVGQGNKAAAAPGKVEGNGNAVVGNGSGNGNGNGNGNGKGKGKGKGRGRGGGGDATGLAEMDSDSDADDGGGKTAATVRKTESGKKGSAAAGEYSYYSDSDDAGTAPGVPAIASPRPSAMGAAPPPPKRRAAVAEPERRNASALGGEDVAIFDASYEGWVDLDGASPADYIGSQLIRFYTMRTFMAPVYRAIYKWLMYHTHVAAERGIPSEQVLRSRKYVKLFITVFTEVLRFSFYAHLGIRNQYRQSATTIQVPWLEALRKEAFMESPDLVPPEEDDLASVDSDDLLAREIRKNRKEEWFWKEVKDMPDDERLTVKIRNKRRLEEVNAEIRERQREEKKGEEVKLDEIARIDRKEEESDSSDS